MILVDNGGQTDPRYNLALEEHVFRTRDVRAESYVFLYVNRPSVVIGRHQNVLEEIDPEFTERAGIRLVRRISGGGAVFHDEGNLNFSFITQYAPDRFNNYREFTRPIIDALRALGLDAGLNERNDITAAGCKISGNAQFTSRERMLSHGTLLFNSDLGGLRSSLTPARPDLESNSTKSVRSRVANISELLPDAPDFAAFQQHIRRAVAGVTPRLWRPDAGDLAAVQALAEGKYSSWEWNYGRSPRFVVERTLNGGKDGLRVLLEVRQGLVAACAFSGGPAADYLNAALYDIAGRRYWRGDLSDYLLQRLDAERLRQWDLNPQRIVGLIV